MKLSAEEYMDLCKRCWHSYIAFPAADFELAYANNVSPLDACTAIWSIHRKELSLTDPEAAPTQGADARPVAIIPPEWLALMEECATFHGKMVKGNWLSSEAKRLLATRDATPSVTQEIDMAWQAWQAARASAEQRDSILEECALICEAENPATGADCARDIRALKSQQDVAIESQRSGDGS